MLAKNIARADRIAERINGYPDKSPKPNAEPSDITDEELNDTLTDCFHLLELTDVHGETPTGMVAHMYIDGGGHKILYKMDVPQPIAELIRHALENYVRERNGEEQS